tara:strand:+ start:414 stop:581 length:168 start_codon:yes stop_codon:yes gene_type:complete
LIRFSIHYIIKIVYHNAYLNQDSISSFFGKRPVANFEKIKTLLSFTSNEPVLGFI